MKEHKKNINDLSILLLASIFMNGFETGGYQASLLYIGEEYSLDHGAQGVIASVELFATMIAPILLGSIADKVGKKIMLTLFTAMRVLSCFIILMATNSVPFAVGVFILGFATSIIQYVAIAEMDDAYPVTRHKRMGGITAMYAFGAVVAPLIVGMAIKTPFGWKSFFGSDCIISFVLAVMLWKISFKPREEVPAGETTDDEVTGSGGKIYITGVALLCMIMFIYVGVENGVGFFLNGFMHDKVASTRGYIALSLFWMAMIPSRVLCGYFCKYRHILLCAAPTGAAILLAILSAVTNEYVAFVIVFILGFFCGAVYPNVLTYAADFSGTRTATVTAAITVATGVGGTVVSAIFGFLETAIGFTGSFRILAFILALDLLFALPVVMKKKKRV
ncbi:MFS transporter [Oribacterium sp. WCC10]|uniref:MFS transporter n=1 Tax=Oribacterium sp. WCC10 TaxID=1855343 RepID=UPI0008E2129C|nr:MFS transporter [Oribacterium sp. WCC10]SFG81963.1 Fucose permease [Oribacterium sp. WCC10]